MGTRFASVSYKSLCRYYTMRLAAGLVVGSRSVNGVLSGGSLTAKKSNKYPYIVNKVANRNGCIVY